MNGLNGGQTKGQVQSGSNSVVKLQGQSSIRSEKLVKVQRQAQIKVHQPAVIDQLKKNIQSRDPPTQVVSTNQMPSMKYTHGPIKNTLTR